MPRYQQSIAFQRCTIINRRVRSPLCSRQRRFAVAQYLQQRDPSSEAVGIWRMSDKELLP